MSEPSDWDSALAAVVALRSFEASDDTIPPSSSMIAWAVAFVGAWRGTHAAPRDVFPMPDGAIAFEWDLEGGGISNLEIVGPGEGELMTIAVSGARAEFTRVEWEEVYGERDS